jgi:malate synthase
MAVAIKETSERELIVGTISDIQDSIQELSMTIDSLSDDLNAKQQRLLAWKKKLEVIDGAPGTSRRPKGANLRAIAACLENAISGLSASEVRTRTGIPWSSVQRVLAQHPDRFVEVSGVWKLRQRISRVIQSNVARAIAAKSLPTVDDDPFELEPEPDDETEPEIDNDEESV